MELQGHMVTLYFNLLEELQDSLLAGPLYIPPAMYEYFNFSTSSPMLAVIHLLLLLL